MKSNQLKITDQIKLMNVLEDFVLKNIKYPFGDQRERIKYYKSRCLNLPEPKNTIKERWQTYAPIQQSEPDLQSHSEQNPSEYRYELTKQDKKSIYARHAIGEFKETDQQKKYREEAVKQAYWSDDPNDIIEIPLIDRLPRHYDDILTDIQKFFYYIQSQENINLKQVEILRKKAFYTYAMHNDCRYLPALPKELYVNFEKIHNGNQQQISTDIIKKSFLKYAEEILLNEKEVNKISSINKDIIIQKLTKDSIPFVKKDLIQKLKSDIELLHIQLTHLDYQKNSPLYLADPDQQEEPIYIFNDRTYFDVTRRKYKKRISNYQIKIKELESIGVSSAPSIRRKKFTGDSETWLKQHKMQDQSLYHLIKEIVKKNRQTSYIKNKNS